MSAAIWIVGVWLLVSLPFALFIGRMCSLNSLDSDALLISGELPINSALRISDKMPTTAATAVDLAAFGAAGIPA